MDRGLKDESSHKISAPHRLPLKAGGGGGGGGYVVHSYSSANHF